MYQRLRTTDGLGAFFLVTVWTMWDPWCVLHVFEVSYYSSTAFIVFVY